VDPFRVLVVEDSPSQRLALTQLLEELPGLRVEAAGTLAEALAAIRANPPDAVTLDLELPDATQLQALSAIRALAPGLPVVVVTAGGVSLRGTAALAGAGWVGKEDLTAERLKDALGLATLRGAVEQAAKIRDAAAPGTEAR
jgi:two-component system, repressor protein LuxO